MWQILEAIKAFFKFGESVNKVVEKSLPSEKIQEEKFELKKPRLAGKEITKLFDKRFHDLRHHPELDIRENVRLICGVLNDEDEELLVSQLTARLNADEIYNKAKLKKGKFDYPTKP